MLVTCYYDIYGKPERFFEYASLFYDLGISGLPIVLFVDPYMVYKFRIFPSTVHVIGLSLTQVELYQMAISYTGELPTKRTPAKDTKEFYGLMNAKIEFIKRAADIFPDQTFSWIDFGICKIFKNTQQVIAKLFEIEKQTFTTIRIPGCWNPSRPMNIDNISWVFCGGYLVIPRTLVHEFFTHLKGVLRDFCTMPQYKLTWETNVWSIVYSFAMKDKMEWYQADHNSSIICNLPI
jgi:hypothetical protein